MNAFQIIAILALICCVLFCFAHFLRLIKLGKPNDLSQKAGNVPKAVIYSNTVAMAPQNKESAYKHLPTYTAGIIFHLGTFLSLLLFILLFFPFFTRFLADNTIITLIIDACLAVSSVCGVSLFIKRAVSQKLKLISNFDDYLSNGLTTLTQISTLLYTLMLLMPDSQCSMIVYYIVVSLLLLYLPFGKLRHVVYYFAARFQLGYFYGWRNSWPPTRQK